MRNTSELAASQLRDYDARTPGMLFTDPIPLSEEQAYAVQSEVCRLREQRGETMVGYKVGCTSPVVQRQLGIDHRVFGRLFDSECWPSGKRLPSAQFSGLAIEGELAVRLARDLPDFELSEGELTAAIESVFAVIELHNFIFRRSEPSAEELIANNAIHAGFIYATNHSSRLNLAPATLCIKIDEVEVATVSGVELTHTISDSLHWLSGELGRRGHILRAGQTILCGSVADLIPAPQGCHIAVTTDRFGLAECTIDDHQQRRPQENYH